MDRSNTNGPADADHLGEAGVTAIYLKASEGAYYTDTTYLARREAADKVTIRHGAYHFGRPDTPAGPFAEAKHFLGVIGKPQPGRLRPALDLERSGPDTLSWAITFVNVIHGTLGYWPVLYGSTSFIAPLLQQSAVLRNCAWWRAEYGPDDGHDHPLQGGAMGAAIHQYTSKAHLPGLPGDCDVNLVLREAGIYVPGVLPNPMHFANAAWRWAAWYVGIGPYKGHGHYAYEHGVPRSSPPPLPANMVTEAWACVRWYTSHGVGA